MQRPGYLAVISGVLGFALVLAACSPAAPASSPAPAKQEPAASAPKTAQQQSAQPAAKSQHSAAVQKLIDGAKQEKVLKGLWSATSFGGAPGLKRLVDGMNKMYGTSIEAQFTPGPNMQGVMERLVQEQAAGQPASADVFLGNAPAMLDAVKANNLLSVDWKAILPRELPSNLPFDPVNPGGIGVAFASTLVGITYNSDVVKGDDVPKSMYDALNAKWKGKIASTPYVSGMREFAHPEMLGFEKTKEFTEQLSKQVGGLIRCGESDRLTSQEFVMLVFDCGGDEAIRSRDTGAPLGHAVIKEGTVVHLRFAGVPKNSASPNAAQLFIAYLHSEEGQKTLWELDGMDFHIYPAANTREPVESVLKSGGKVFINTPQNLQAFTSYEDYRRQFEQIMQQAAGG